MIDEIVHQESECLMSADSIKHVFVLMLENRAFDHMLGYSGITGSDAESGEPTKVNGVDGSEVNTYNGTPYLTKQGADWVMPVDPGHEFLEVLEQLSGPGVAYPSGGAYPPINNSGFVTSYVAVCAAAQKQSDPGEIMKCYGPNQLPVLNALAREFVICDRWHASMPGPTWPNRMCLHAASSGGLDHSPTTAEIVLWETLNGFQFSKGTIFDALKQKNVSRRLYGGDDFPMLAALKGIGLDDIRPYHYFAQDLQDNYLYAYTFIEPSYNATADYKCSTSQHPLDDVTRGEALIKCTYEAIRNSPIWNNSLLILTWDEHGGFYDHVVPPEAVAPGDTVPGSSHNQYGFTFERCGLRVPAVIISPLIPRNLIDHRLYDHASVPATLEVIFDLQPLTNRDGAAKDLTPLLTLSAPRADAPTRLPSPAQSGVGGCPPFSCSGPELMELASVIPEVSDPTASVNIGNLPSVIHAAMRQDLALDPTQKDQILAQVSSLRTRGDAAKYLEKVRQKLRAMPGPASPKA
jgi:phospholipase C